MNNEQKEGEGQKEDRNSETEADAKRGFNDGCIGAARRGGHCIEWMSG